MGQLRPTCKSTTASFFSSLGGLDFLCFYLLQPQIFLKAQEMGLITTSVRFDCGQIATNGNKNSNKLFPPGINCTPFSPPWWLDDASAFLPFPFHPHSCCSVPGGRGGARGGGLLLEGPREVRNKQNEKGQASLPEKSVL